MSPGTIDGVWRERDTTPGAIDAAIRKLLVEAHARDDAHVPARVMNLVCVVDQVGDSQGSLRARVQHVLRVPQ